MPGVQGLHGLEHCAMQRNWHIVLGQFQERQRYTDLLAARRLMQDGPCDLSELADRELFMLTRAMFDALRGSIKVTFSKGLDHLRSVQGDSPLWPDEPAGGGGDGPDASTVTVGGHVAQGARGNASEGADNDGAQAANAAVLQAAHGDVAQGAGGTTAHNTGSDDVQHASGDADVAHGASGQGHAAPQADDGLDTAMDTEEASGILLVDLLLLASSFHRSQFAGSTQNVSSEHLSQV